MAASLAAGNVPYHFELRQGSCCDLVSNLDGLTIGCYSRLLRIASTANREYAECFMGSFSHPLFRFENLSILRLGGCPYELENLVEFGERQGRHRIGSTVVDGDPSG